MKKVCLFISIIVLGASTLCFGFTAWDTENSTLLIGAYLRTDVVNWKNVVSLDSANKNDRTTYFGLDYNVDFKSEFKDGGPIFYLKLERNGPYDYDAPLFIDNSLMVAGGNQIAPYRNTELLPQIEEFWADVPVLHSPIRFKIGLFPYEVGKGYVQGSGSFENYGVSVYKPGEDFSWRFHYYRPDLVYKTPLGPRIEQEKEEWIRYEPNAANYFAFDSTFSSKENTFQPFIGILLDHTSAGKRANLFATPVHKEILGTLGLDYDLHIKNFAFGLEAARNFGQAESEDSNVKDVEHKGYLIYAESSLAIDSLSPHVRFLYSSGNKVTTEMVERGDTQFVSGANKAFSTYSPLNTNFFDSHSPTTDMLPLVFCGWGYGLNYGVGLNRPSTLADDGVLENLIMPSLGFDYKLTDKLQVTLDWWYMMANEKGVGMWGGVAKELARDLGQEIDLSLEYAMNDHISFGVYSGYFFPGRYFKEERDDAGGSLFTPFVRGDGNADGAYQLELTVEYKF